MKKAALQVATFVGALSCLGPVNATETRMALVPLPSIDDFTNGDGWGFGLGLSVENETAYEGSDEFETKHRSHIIFNIIYIMRSIGFHGMQSCTPFYKI